MSRVISALRVRVSPAAVACLIEAEGAPRLRHDLGIQFIDSEHISATPGASNHGVVGGVIGDADLVVTASGALKLDFHSPKIDHLASPQFGDAQPTVGCEEKATRAGERYTGTGQAKQEAPSGATLRATSLGTKVPATQGRMIRP